MNWEDTQLNKAQGAMSLRQYLAVREYSERHNGQDAPRVVWDEDKEQYTCAYYSEWRLCCDKIQKRENETVRDHSRRLTAHCSTIEHVSRKYRIDEKELRGRKLKTNYLMLTVLGAVQGKLKERR